jgi:hypothetical protein
VTATPVGPLAASPFASALGRQAASLPPALRLQFLPDAELGPVVVEGRMAQVWRRPRWLWPLFRLLASADVLFPETGREIPARLVITSLSDGRGCARQRWHRTVQFQRRRRFDATIVYDPALGRVVELTGPGEVLEFPWDVRFEPPDAVCIEAVGMRLRLGRRRLALPLACSPSVHVRQRALPDCPDGLALSLTVSLPILGPVFGYAGSVRIRAEADR